jgi:glutamate synthase domain-containing protein 1
MIMSNEHSVSRNISVNDFSGGSLGLPKGACGLLAVVGDFSLNALLKAARCLQYRGRTGAGVTLKNLYKDANFFNFHIMFRSEDKISALEEVLSGMGLRILEKKDMVQRKFYYEYDLPVIMHYSIIPPSPDEMMFRERINDEMQYIARVVSRFNRLYIDDARIFSSSKNNGTFLTAFELEDTISIYDIHKFEDHYYDACLIHLRWPTSQGRGLWWGPQPISLGEFAGVHNGHLSSDMSNARALEQLDIMLTAGTDSEAIFLSVEYLLNKGYTLEEIEWVMCRKFPQELTAMTQEKRARYEELMADPFLFRMKMSGPATAITMVGDVVVGFTDRDHLRSFSIGVNDKVALLGSEQRAVISAAYFMHEELNVYDPEAGKIVGFSVKDKRVSKLDYGWKKNG